MMAKRAYKPKADAPPKVPYHEQVATKLIEQLEAGTAPWQRPWTPGSLSLPHNPVSGTKYRGSNVIWLQMHGHADPRWMTYKQAAGIGAQVRKGEHGTIIQYWKVTDRVLVLDDQGKPVMRDGEKVYRNVQLDRPRSFSSVVFNASQIDGLPPLMPSTPAWDRHDRAEALLQATGADIKHDQANDAFYRPATDRIHMPTREQFPDADGYYSTALHEVGHWTGHHSRLARDLAHPFRTEGYAKEELRAEIASLMLGDELGIGHDPGQHAAYVKSWIKVLKEDPKEIVRAAKDADRITAYVLDFERERAPTAAPAPTVESVPAPVLIIEPPSPADQVKAPVEAVTTPPVAVADVTVTPEASNPPAWHTPIPEYGLAVLPEDLTGRWPTGAVDRVVADAAKAVTERQRQPEQVTVPGDSEPHVMAPPLLYAYVLPATETHHGAIRLLPDDQPKPDGWGLVDQGGIRPGLMDQEQLSLILQGIASRARIISSATEPTPTETPVDAHTPPPAVPVVAPFAPVLTGSDDDAIPEAQRLRFKALLIRPTTTHTRIEEIRRTLGTRYVAEVWRDARPALAAAYGKLGETLDAIPDDANRELARRYLADRLPASYVTSAEAAYFPDGRAADLPRPDWAQATAPPSPVAAVPDIPFESREDIQVRLQQQTHDIFSRLQHEHGWVPMEAGKGLQKSFPHMRNATEDNPSTDGPPLTIQRSGPVLVVMYGALHMDRFGLARDAGATYADTVNAEVDDFVRAQRAYMGVKIQPEPAPIDQNVVNIRAYEHAQTTAILSRLQQHHGWTPAEDGFSLTKSFPNMRLPTPTNPSSEGIVAVRRQDGAHFVFQHADARAGNLPVPVKARVDFADRLNQAADEYVAAYRLNHGLPDPAVHPIAGTPPSDRRYSTAAGESLAKALERRDLKAAIDVLRPLSVKDARLTALEAGLAVARSKNKAEFFADIQGQLLKATRGPERTQIHAPTATRGPIPADTLTAAGEKTGPRQERQKPALVATPRREVSRER